MGNEQHAVACGDAEERDESDDGRYAHFARCEKQHEDSADEGERQVDEHHGALADAAELHEQEQEDDDDAQH